MKTISPVATGLAAALFAFSFWGVAPLYFKLLAAVPAAEIIGHRIIWSAVFLSAFLLWRDGPGFWRGLQLKRRELAMLLLSGTLVAINWLVFVWAVIHDQVLATSLGYFINPLVSVVLGMLFLGEQLSRLRWLAFAVAAVSTTWMAMHIGKLPWVALTLAVSFGFYGLVRKQLAVGPLKGLLWEAILLSVPVAAWFLWLGPDQPFAFGHGDVAINLLLMGSGLVTLLPLLAFNVAAKNLDLSVVGFVQYLAPTISFLLAVFIFHEPFDQVRLLAFCGIWLSLLLFTIDPLLRRRRRLRLSAVGPDRPDKA
ncbi:MAG: EamA family transporter RarD [Gammaproteobacteria bacterium]|nr:EamA family transporter RarD [Gammaproteobacteria bacterium]